MINDIFFLYENIIVISNLPHKSKPNTKCCQKQINKVVVLFLGVKICYCTAAASTSITATTTTTTIATSTQTTTAVSAETTALNNSAGSSSTAEINYGIVVVISLVIMMLACRLKRYVFIL